MFGIIRAVHSVSPIKKFEIVSEVDQNGNRKHRVNLHFDNSVQGLALNQSIRGAGYAVFATGRGLSDIIIFKGKFKAQHPLPQRRFQSGFSMKGSNDGKTYTIEKVRLKGGADKGVPLGLVERPLLERKVARLLRPKF